MTQEKKQVWYEDYRECHCTFIADMQIDLPEYCPRHSTVWKTRKQIPDIGFDRGLVEQ